MNHFDRLPTDVKLHLFSFLNDVDTMAVTAANKVNHQLQDKTGFWRMLMLRDFKTQISAGQDAKKLYLELQKNRICKIRNAGICIMGIDRAGGLHVVDGTYKPLTQDEENRAYTIARFAENNKIIDMIWSSGGSTYFLTPDGLYGFGNNIYSQLGINTDGHPINDIRLIYPAKQDDKILGFTCGIHYVAVQTQNKLWIAGDIALSHNSQIEMTNYTDAVSIQAGYSKLWIRHKDNSFTTIGKNPHDVQNAFRDKKIHSSQAAGEQVAVWCEDGIYLKHYTMDNDITFARLEFFDDKVIQSVNVGAHHVLVHCQDGVYAMGANVFFELGTGDNDYRKEFTKINIDSAGITNIAIPSWSYIEMRGRWQMSGKPLPDNQRNPYFSDITFTPLSTLVPQKRREMCVIA